MRNSQVTRLQWAALALLPALVLGACGQRSSTPQGTELAAELTSSWTRAFDAGDAAALAALYAEDAHSMPPSSGPLVGRASIESYWRSDIGPGGATTRLTPTGALAHDDLLQVEGTYEVTGKGSTELARGHFQQTWTRAGDRWQVVREMWRMDPALVRSIDLATRLTSDWTKAYNAGDAAALAAMYDEEAVLSTIQEGSFAARPAIQKFWAEDFGDGTPSSTLTLTDAYVSGELAHLEGEYKVADRASITNGRFVQLWMRDGDAWRVHREMWLR